MCANCYSDPMVSARAVTGKTVTNQTLRDPDQRALWPLSCRRPASFYRRSPQVAPQLFVVKRAEAEAASASTHHALCDQQLHRERLECITGEAAIIRRQSPIATVEFMR